MYTIRFDALCLGGFAEILPDDLESATCAVEEYIALALLELFSAIHIVAVEITCASDAAEVELMSGNLQPPVA
ncbi:MAG: hypothetical protein WCD86_07710 [Ktedonobacteraceae bacterium]